MTDLDSISWSAMCHLQLPADWFIGAYYTLSRILPPVITHNGEDTDIVAAANISHWTYCERIKCTVSRLTRMRWPDAKEERVPAPLIAPQKGKYQPIQPVMQGWENLHLLNSTHLLKVKKVLLSVFVSGHLNVLFNSKQKVCSKVCIGFQLYPLAWQRMRNLVVETEANLQITPLNEVG